MLTPIQNPSHPQCRVCDRTPAGVARISRPGPDPTPLPTFGSGFERVIPVSSISEIARRLGLSRNTVKRWLKAEAGTEPRYRRKPRPTKLSPYEGQLVLWLEADSHRPKRERRTALALCAQLKALGYPGSYTRVSEYVRRWRVEGARSLKGAFVPLKFEFVFFTVNR